MNKRYQFISSGKIEKKSKKKSKKLNEPTLIDPIGKYWLKNNKRHRDGDLPAIIMTSGDKYWFRDGLLHRDNDQPAIEYADGHKEFWVHGKRTNE